MNKMQSQSEIRTQDHWIYVSATYVMSYSSYLLSYNFYPIVYHKSVLEGVFSKTTYPQISRGSLTYSPVNLV